jgi:hypothetical protein
MTNRRRSVHRMMPALWAAGVAVLVTGCGRTLVFGERDGVNFAVRANGASAPPIEVNFGLDRVIATIVPPAGESGSQPSGEAVNMFAGFQVERPNNPDLTKPVAADLKIDTQFASGAAAKSVAGSPTLVAHIVTLGGITIQRTPEFLATIKDRQQLVAAIHGLTDDQSVALATAMLPKLSTRPQNIQNALAPQVALLPQGTMPPTIARSILNRWAILEIVTSDRAAEWATALAQAKR